MTMRSLLSRMQHALQHKVVLGATIAFFSLIGSFSLAGAVHAETCTWTHVATDLVSDAGNWAGCTLDATDDLVFGAGDSTSADFDGGTYNTLTVQAGYTGTVTVSADATVTSDLIVAGVGGSFNIANTVTLNVGGDLLSNLAGIINGDFGASTTIHMTGAGKTIGGTGTIIFDNLSIAGTDTLGGDVTSTHALYINAGGSLDGSTFDIVLTGIGTPFVNSGTFTASNGAVHYNGDGATTILSETYYDLITSTTATLGGNVTSTDGLEIAAGSLDASTFSITFAVAGTPFSNAGTFDAGTGVVYYIGDGATTIVSGTYYDLITSTTATLGGNVTTTNGLSIAAGSFDASTFNLTLTAAGVPFTNSGTFTAGTGRVTYNGDGATTLAALSYYDLTVSTTATLLSHTTSTHVLTLASTGSSLSAGASNLAFTGTGTPFVRTGTFTPGTGRVMYNGDGATNIAAGSYYNLTVSTTATLLGHTTSTHVLTMASAGSSISAGTFNLAFTGTGTPFVFVGTFTPGTGTVIYNGDGATNIAATSYYNLIASTTATLLDDTTSTHAFTNDFDLTIGDGIVLAAAGTYDNNGTVTETGTIQHAAESVDFTDMEAEPAANYDTGDNILYVTVEDQDANLDATEVETLTGITVVASTYSDSETLTLTETGADTGIFIGSKTVALAESKGTSNDRFEVSGSGTFTLAFVDSNDSGDTGSDSATYTGRTYTASSGGSHGGGGGSSSAGGPSRTSQQPVSNQENIVLSNNSRTTLKVGKTTHHITRISADKLSATIVIESNPITVTLNKNETKNLDTDGDKKLDLAVQYLGLVVGNPKFRFTDLTVTDAAPVPTPAPNPAPVVVPPVTAPVMTPVTPSPVVTPVMYQFTKQLTLGSRGAEVTKLQEKLKTLGYFTAVPNGNFGPMTRAAVIKFQQAKGITPAAGLVGPATRAALNGVSNVVVPTPSVTAPAVSTRTAFNRNLAVGSNGADVLALQQVLKNLGYFTAVPNGNYGPMTRAAVIKFQQAKGLAPLGIVGPNTRKALNSL